ncbi:DUF3370 domain-containing protein [Oscillatoria amoena NRMC-F 0135]|nr:DUF3370 domain-containing protein [Geitlerinema splendidum]MDL5045619.1 DUF3370 domain-containing protein [Oscillatoria amoena NRMC-F 0135]
MLPFLSAFLIAQTPPTLTPRNSAPTITPPSRTVPGRPTPRPTPSLPPPETLPAFEELPLLERLPHLEVMHPAELRSLPGRLDSVPVFNSNSPELVQTEGILLSTFPPEGKRNRLAHLNFAFNGRFDIFSHHVTRARTPEETRSFYQGIILYNPLTQPVTVEILQGASYLTRPDALFVTLPPVVDNPVGRVFAGPGSRAMNDILRGRRQENLPSSVVVPPGQYYLLMNVPIPAGTVTPTSNGRSTLLRLQSSGPIYVANLAMRAPQNANGSERPPELDEWETLLVNGTLAGPRDLAPSALDAPRSRMVYGRVAGVAEGSKWLAKLTDNERSDRLTIPQSGRAFAYGLSTLHQGRLGTEQIQSAKMLVRYPDTAYYAHGNYGVEYNLTLPLHNPTKERQTVTLSLSTPVKDDTVQGTLLFFNPPEERIFFRGTVRLRFANDLGLMQSRYVHLVQNRGHLAEPLLTLELPPNSNRRVEVDFLYPPDATPPQVLMVRTQ